MMAVASLATAALGLAASNLTLNGLRETDGAPFPRDAPAVLQWAPAGAARSMVLSVKGGTRSHVRAGTRALRRLRSHVA